MLDATMLTFVRESLPAPPARVLEVGAGKGELAVELASLGYDVVAIDPKAEGPVVRPVFLHKLDEPVESFDAAVAVLSMHHVDPLTESCRRLAEVIRPAGVLVLDEIDFACFDERSAGWWLEHHGAAEHAGSTPEEIVSHLREHCHELARIRSVLTEWFELGATSRGPYLYRWELSPELRATELDLIMSRALPATGARIVGTRR
ncbi:MAG TPA: methyltransferase domain-containing protein [Solirubrobacteraceae bacterium]|nr:methyltransferase domain-containing protein [Solirubrobacteraceae bacterium]